MEQLPLVSAELLHVMAGLRVAADELGAARQVVTEVGSGSVATPSCDAAVEAGLRDLALVLQRLEITASAGVLTLGRYGDTAHEGRRAMKDAAP